MTNYFKYQGYKETDYSHIGVVPSHWDLKRTKFLFERQNRPPRDCDDTVTAFRDGQVTLRTNRRTDGFTQSLKEIGYQGVRCGDLVVHAMDGFAGAIGVSDSDGKCSPVYSICKPVKDSADSKYYGLFLRNLALNGYVESLAKGIRERSTEFRYAELKEVWLPEPPIEEQVQIANFLDHETAKIDTLIDKQQQLIKLLKEKRQAVISHAVTKGLNPDAPMKDSGVEWLGEVPEHWEVVRMRYLCNITTGGRDTQDAKEDGAYPFFVRSDTIERIDSYSFDGEGVMTSGDGAGVGKIFHHFVGKCEIHQRVYLFHQFRKIKGRLLYLFIKENLGRIVLAQSAKSTVDSLRLPMLQDFPICFGPEKEQGQICEYIEVFSHKIERLLEKAESSILLLKERRTALISAAVTGKIDVHNLKADQSESRMENING